MSGSPGVVSRRTTRYTAPGLMDTLPGLTIREQQFLEIVMINCQYFGASPITALRVAALLIEDSCKKSAPKFSGKGTNS
jgi:hypothetical protein